ncbi:MAG: hypothetical protein J2P15_08825 [Micromonosporaceae bacterium]|nr:hypothetical protein [Micromonosporaceae bacterium]
MHTQLTAGRTSPMVRTVRATTARPRTLVTGSLVLGMMLIAGAATGCAVDTGQGRSSQVPATPTRSAGGSPAPDGRIDRTTLLNTRLRLPPWPQRTGTHATCGTSNVKLTDEPHDVGVVELSGLAYGDADGDGAQESVAIVGCRMGESAVQQVVVFDRDAAGRIVPLGQVVAAGADIDWITDVAASAPGSVRVQVGDIQPCCDVKPENVQKQWRTYGWDGTGFHQIAGPTKFGVNPLRSDLGLAVGDVTFGPAAGDRWRHGTIAVTIHNGGPGRADQMTVNLNFGKGAVRHEGSAWSACTNIFDETLYDGRGAIQFELRTSLAAGETRTLVLGVATGQPMTGKGQAQVSAYLLDLANADNQATFTIR